jgi:hypothetical protein
VQNVVGRYNLKKRVSQHEGTHVGLSDMSPVAKKILNHMAASMMICVLPLMAGPTLSQTYTLVETIPLSGVDILNLSTDGTNLLILNNGDVTDSVAVFTTTGSFLSEFPAESRFCSGITSDGTSYIFTRGAEGFFRMDPASGQVTGPFGQPGSALGLSFDGTHILTSEYATGDNGILIERIYLFDPLDFNNVGSFTLTADTGASFDATPVYGVARHDGEILLNYQGLNRLLRFNAGGNVVGTINVTDGVVGISFVGQNLFVADRGTQAVYRYVVVPEPTSFLISTLSLLVFALRTRASRHSTMELRQFG